MPFTIRIAAHPPGPGFGPHVRFYEPDGSLIHDAGFMAYGTHKYGVNVAAGDLGWDRLDELVTGARGGDPEEDLWVDDHAQLDFLFRVQLTKRFSIVLEAINITDEPYTVYEGVADRIRQQEYYDWWATLGVRFDF